MKITDCVIAFSFGYTLARSGQKFPGSSNIAIASIVKEISLDGTPIITQQEISDCLTLSNNEKIVLNIRTNHIDPLKYLDTYEVAYQAVEFMRKESWTRAWMVAHPAHLWRCKKVLEKMGITAIEPPILAGVDNNIPFNLVSSQIWTRNPFFWWLREIPTICYYWYKGWI